MSKRVDKGFKLNYWKLSYRRKFIRTLWFMPLSILLAGFMFYIGSSIFMNRIIPIIILLLGIFQLIYNYIKWKKCE